MRQARRQLLGYVASVCILSAVALIGFALSWGWPKPIELGFFWFLYIAADRLQMDAVVRGIPQAGLPVRAPSLSACFLVILVCAFSTDPATTAALGLLAALGPGSHRGALRIAFNGAQESLYGGMASACFVTIRFAMGDGLATTLLATAAAALTAVLFNTTLVAGAFAIERRRRLDTMIRELAWPTPNSLAFALLALLVGLLYRNSGLVAVLFIVAPLFVLRHARQGMIELEAARAGTLRAFVSAVDLKSPWTSQHSANVAAIVVAMHRQLGSGDAQLEKRYYGALLHDIGKVAVSGAVLSKSSLLSDAEWDEVRRHPGAGAFVVNEVEFLRDLVPEILYHHERLDGSGYPSGLRDDSIPFEARVLAVADSFEALTSDRPYRSGLSHQEALDELRRCSGAQLDPLAVEALAQLIDGGHQLPSSMPMLVPSESSSSHSVRRGA